MFNNWDVFLQKYFFSKVKCRDVFKKEKRDLESKIDK